MMSDTVLRPILCGALVLGLVACGTAGSTSREGPTATPAPTSTAITASTTPVRTSTYAERRQGRFAADGADALVAAAGALWVKTDLGHVIRIDPQAGRITADVVVDKRTGQSFYCLGIGAVPGSVWACATRAEGVGLARIDPVAAKVTQVVPVGKVFDQLSLPSTARGIWVLTEDGTAVSVVDPASGHVSSYPLGARCQQLATSGDRVVATSVVENSVIVLDAGSGEVLDRLSVVSPRMAALVDEDIWVDSAEGLTHVGPDLATRTVYPGLVAGPDGDLFAEGESVWVRGPGGDITHLDAATGEVLERIVPATGLSAGSLVVAYGSIWTTGSEEGWVIRLREEG